MKLENEGKNEENNDKKINNQNPEKKVEENDKEKIEVKEIFFNEKKIICLKLVMNTMLSLLLGFFLLYIPHTYNDRKWRVFFFMTLWSFTMNSYYIVSVTVIDWIHFIKKRNVCPCYNNFVRNIYLKINFPFAISIVFLYWMLILLGDEYESFGGESTDYASGIFFHGIILVFLLFDMFTSVHVNKINYFWDLLFICIIVCIYFALLGVGKYTSIDFEPYDFMEISSVRQIIGACILIFISILDGYVIFNLIANRFFVKENEYLANQYKSKIVGEDKRLNADINGNGINTFTNNNCNINNNMFNKAYDSQLNLSRKLNGINYELKNIN